MLSVLDFAIPIWNESFNDSVFVAGGAYLKAFLAFADIL